MNKNGWGLRVELAFIIIFLICLMITTIGLINMGLLGDDSNNNSTNSSNFSYQVLENQLNNASIRYYNDYKYDLNDGSVVIRHSTLINSNYIGELIDGNGNKCVGYTKIIKQIDGPSFTSYIKCQNYISNGYEYK